jgi:hypothetical protein
VAKIWRIGGWDLAVPEDLPANAVVQIGWRLPSAGLLASDAQSRRDGLELYRHLGGFLGGSVDIQKRDVQTRVFERINQALLRGEVVAFRQAATGGVGDESRGNPVQQSSRPSSQDQPRSSSSSPTEKSSDKTWVDVQLLDENGDPVAGERYILKLTDGSIREGTLGEDGRVRVNGIDPGNCVVTFPDIDTKEWWRKS